VEGDHDLCLTVNSGFVPKLSDNIGQTLIIDDCLDALLHEDGRDLWMFYADHKIRSYYNYELCMEGSIDHETITIEDCNNGHAE